MAIVPVRSFALPQGSGTARKRRVKAASRGVKIP